jgi:hypothetical protein
LAAHRHVGHRGRVDAEVVRETLGELADDEGDEPEGVAGHL